MMPYATTWPQPGRQGTAGNGRLGPLLYTVGLPAVLVALAVAAHVSGFDLMLSDRFFDVAGDRFPLRTEPLLELLGHRVAKSAVLAVFAGLLAAALASYRFEALRPWRAVLWATVGAMALGPTLVVVLKSFTAFPCPWSLQRYGGLTPMASTWFATPANAGNCFPAGHSAGGFSLFALVFAAGALGRPRLAWTLFWAALATGVAFSSVRIVQGAHFASHALWAAAIDWLAAGLVFLAICERRGRERERG